jgi:hypothetical protein
MPDVCQETQQEMCLAALLVSYRLIDLSCGYFIFTQPMHLPGDIIRWEIGTKVLQDY